MAAIGTFEIEGSFKITGRGLVIYGDIISGTVSLNNSFTFNNGEQDIKLKIKGVDFVDKIEEKIAKIGLTFHYDNVRHMEDLQMLQVTKQTAAITEL